MVALIGDAKRAEKPPFPAIEIPPGGRYRIALAALGIDPGEDVRTL
jgi:hypothetical protein